MTTLGMVKFPFPRFDHYHQWRNWKWIGAWEDVVRLPNWFVIQLYQEDRITTAELIKNLSVLTPSGFPRRANENSVWRDGGKLTVLPDVDVRLQDIFQRRNLIGLGDLPLIMRRVCATKTDAFQPFFKVFQNEGLPV